MQFPIVIYRAIGPKTLEFLARHSVLSAMYAAEEPFQFIEDESDDAPENLMNWGEWRRTAV